MKLTLNQRSRFAGLLRRLSDPQELSLDLLADVRQEIGVMNRRLAETSHPEIDLSPLTYLLSDLSDALREFKKNDQLRDIAAILSDVRKGQKPPSNKDVIEALRELSKTVEQSAKRSGSVAVGGAYPIIQDRKTFTAGQDSVAPLGGVFREDFADLTAGQAGGLRATKQRALHVNTRDASGNEISPATETTLASLAAKDFATQTTLALVKAKTDNLDLAITALRDALRGTNSKTLSDIVTALSSVPVTGTFWQTTQPVSQIALPLATNVTSTKTLTSANTAYQIASIPSSAYLLVLCNASDTDMYWGFATLTTGGILLAKSGGTVAILCAASVSPYFYCASAGKVLNYSTTVL